VKTAILAVLSAALLCGCASMLPTAANKYDPADLEQAIAIATKAGDVGPLSCYQALKVALQTQPVGALSLYEYKRVTLPTLKLACVPISLP
jgi:hypothetical protein